MRIVSEVQGQANALMDELNEIRKEQDREAFSKKALAARSQLRSKLDKLHDTANPIAERENISYTLPRPLKAGDTVLIVDIDKEGTVLQPPDKSGNVLVQAGIIKSRVKLENLRLIETKKVQFNGSKIRGAGKGSVKKSMNVSGRSASTECDLRGMTTDEAIFVLDSFIDNAVLTHIQQITIIHGKGTGALRAEKLAGELRKSGVNAKCFTADVGDLSSVMQMKKQIEDSMGAPDIIVDAAVVQYQPWTSVLQQPTEDYESQFRSCVMHNVNMAKAFVPAMQKKGWGRFIGINTECAMQCFPGQSAYAAAKRGMDGVLRVLAKEVGEFGITVNQIAPGWTISDNWRREPI